MSDCGDWIITFESLPNGSVKVVQEVVECPDTHYAVAAFLALFSIVAILLNVLLIVTVAASYTLKKKAINLFALSLAVGHMLESVVSVPLSAAFAARQRWPLGLYACRSDAAISEGTLLLTSLSVLLFCLDRALMMKYLHNYRKYMTPTKRTLAIVAAWFVPVLLTSPLLCGYLESYPHEARLSCCTVDADKDVVYGALMLTFGHLLPLCAMITCIVQVARIVHRERKQLKKLQLKRSFAYTEQVFVTPHLRTEQGPTLMVLAVLLLYVLLVLPQAIIVHSDQIANTYNMTQIEEQQAEETRARMENVTIATNETIDEVNGTVAAQQHLLTVRSDAVHEQIFMWLRYGFLILYPIAALTFHKDLRKKAEGLLFCCRPNTVDDYSSVRPISAYVKKSDSAKKSGRSRSQNHVTSYKTPVLFSTANGLHLRVMNSSHRSNMRFLGLDLSLKGSFAPDPEFEIFLNDLTIPSEDLPDTDGIQDRPPEHGDFQDTIELAADGGGGGGGGSPNSADSGVDLAPVRPRSNKPKKTVRFAVRSNDSTRRSSDSDEQSLLPVQSPVALKPTRSRASTPSPSAKKVQQRSRLRQKQPAPPVAPAKRGASLERTFSVGEAPARRRSFPPPVGRGAPRPTNKYRAPSRQLSQQPPSRQPSHQPARHANRARERRRSSTDIELETFTADDSFGVVR
ncbi:uncharacterized protein LOC122388094 [Amphibalanus amphitrite]|uniref:uncharacterized protein LOC122388094 n=1 Tax=Amphibalanus amphitrite TaxID=1232801 RepID=UPI001C921F6B|nr:uncharacterized protein LOC122388094 [Amphibalanus amphitrite]